MHISLNGLKIPLIQTSALVIGAGAAGLNCADELAKRGVDVLLAAPDFDGGTSLNAGSDKQTYHRLSPAGDSVRQLAQDLFSGGHMHGDTALALAAGSSAAFYKLVELGVPFPHDGFGEYVSYRTDHDESTRATSAGPLTSRFMAMRLRESVAQRGVKTVRGGLLRLLTDRGVICGALLYDTAPNRGLPRLTAIACGSVVLCTGGAADLYEHTVFPSSQTGALGAALMAGAKATNLWSWQYGLASTGVRWNLSGTYQQVLPTYRDAAGGDVLEPWIEGNPDDAIFLKGYKWPFDSRGVTSRVDLAVYAAHAEGRGVLLDFHTRDAYRRLDMLGDEARDYLRNSGATQRSPYDRLLHMNPDAAELYRSRGVDLQKELLPIAVCAQHQNGGISVDRWWRSTVEGLYAAGEVAGCFGAYRPGGSALNETQVGSLRAAQHIAAKGAPPPEQFGEETLHQVDDEVAFLESCQNGGDDAAMMHAHLKRQFSLCAGPVRGTAEMKVLLAWARERAKNPHSGDPIEVIKFRDAIAAAQAVLSAMLAQTRSMPCSAGHITTDRQLAPDVLPAPPDNRFASNVIETELRPDGPHSAIRQVRPLPKEEDHWFENVWRAYREKSYF